MTKEEKQEFINFFNTNPDTEQAKQNLMENKIMRKANTNKAATVVAPKANNKVAAKTTKSKAVKQTGGLKIETGIAIPPARRGASEFTQVARQMKIGQSVLVDTLPKGLYNFGKKNNMKFSNRKMEDSKIRIWRVA